jgi:splicing suppressor protein 51
MYQAGKERFIHKKELTIHIVGAYTYELPAQGRIWKEVMHCLPGVQTLTIYFVGPKACQKIVSPTREIPSFSCGCCPECEAKKKERFQGQYAYTYHEYAKKYLSREKHKKPDLIVAFNSGIHEVVTESWTTSLKVMFDLNVLAYFTSYTKGEATRDFVLLEKLGANLLQETI